jgi:hypothetical protein
MVKNVALIVLGVGLILAVAALIYPRLRHRHPLPKSVWISYSEKYHDAGPARTEDYEADHTGEGLFAEERLMWRIKEHPGCVVLTHDRQHADFIVSISVVRFLGGGNVFGEASLYIQRAKGDVVAAERFYQGPESREDIAQQPVTTLWETLCENAPAQ